MSLCCQKLRINGLVTHELGCTESWRDSTRSCKWCGTDFIPETSYQTCCEDSCYRAFHNIYDPESEEEL